MTLPLFHADFQRLQFLGRLRAATGIDFTPWEASFIKSLPVSEVAIPFNDTQRAVIDSLFLKYAVTLLSTPLPVPEVPAPGLIVPVDTPLVTLDTVRAVRRGDLNAILHEVESGKLRWVWDIGSGGDQRQLRFWTRELAEPQTVAANRPFEAIDAILGNRSEWRGQELADLLVVSRSTVHRLRKELNADLDGTVLKCKRSTLVKFFERRLQ